MRRVRWRERERGSERQIERQRGGERVYLLAVLQEPLEVSVVLEFRQERTGCLTVLLVPTNTHRKDFD